MPKTNPVFESMTRLPLGPYTVRIWRTEDSLGEAFHPDREKMLAEIQNLAHAETLGPLTILAKIGAMDRVAAVEVLDATGNGGLYYPSWP